MTTRALLALFLLAGTAYGQGEKPWMQFDFARPGLAVPGFVLKIYEDGTGTYVAENMPPAAAVNRYALTPPEAVNTTTSQPLTLNGLATAKIFTLLRAMPGLTHCASPRKGIADTGAKTLTFHDPAQPDATCSYNYTELKPLAELTNLLQAMASVMDSGRKLQSDQRFDRLALDRDVGLLTDRVRAGQAAGLANIAPLLQAIASDPEVLERVRTQAVKLLEQSALQP